MKWKIFDIYFFNLATFSIENYNNFAYAENNDCILQMYLPNNFNKGTYFETIIMFFVKL